MRGDKCTGKMYVGVECTSSCWERDPVRFKAWILAYVKQSNVSDANKEKGVAS